jgi:phosphatidylserine/phosphatidylglycerophosphate/cardiolipin synthase-like enzyme
MNSSNNEIFRAGVQVVLAAVLWLSVPPSLVATEPVSNAVVTVAFRSECEKMLIEEINGADKEILVAIYNITRRNITGALAHAVRRGVKVRLKYEANSHSDSEKMNDSIAYLESKGVECTPIRMPEKSGIMHDKFTVIDRKRVLTGSLTTHRRRPL